MNRLSLILLLCLISTAIQAQLVCDFTADTTQGCAPVQINFTDLSTGPRPITYYDWDFGNSGFSSLANPSRVYSNPGTYTVRLTVSDGVDTATKTITQYITVHQSPQADFIHTVMTLCIPYKVNFTDNTTLGSAPIQSWKWDYGDLTTPGTTQNPSHDYTLAGTFSVSLEVVDTNGCKSTEQKINLVVVEPPKASFTASVRSDCNPPMVTTFTNTSTGLAPLTYDWDFGDGNGSTSASPTHTYATAGIFDVTLIVTDRNGCKDTLVQNNYITIAQTKADFSFPDTLCKGVLDTFINTSIGANTFQWTFGTQGSSNQRDPDFKFSTSGNHTVKLVASSGPGCLDSISKTVYVQVINPQFTVHYDSICIPNHVRLKSTSTTQGGIDSTMFRFFYSNPPITIGKDEVNRTFPTSACVQKSHDVEIFVQTTAGCRDSVIVPNAVTILNDFVGMTFTSAGACIPSYALFQSNSCFRFPTTSWLWTFNSGNPPATSTVPQPPDTIHYTTRGKYKVTLQVTDSAGCKHEVSQNLAFGDKPHASFIWNKDTVCLDEEVQFTSLSTDSNKITDYDWAFVPGGGAVTKDPKYAFGNNVGWVDVTLEVSDHGCSDDTTVSQAVFVSGPKASVTQRPRCINPLEQAFTGHVVGGYTRYYWDFGDGSPLDSTTLTPTHLYAQQGSYVTKFMVFNDVSGCADTFFYSVTPAPLNAVFTTQYKRSNFCAGETVEFDARGSQGNIGFNYFWNFGDGRTAMLNPQQNRAYGIDSIYTVQLIIMSKDSCFDTATKDIYIHKPVAATNFTDSIICAGDSVVMLDSSYLDSTKTIYRWYLDSVLVSSDSLLARRWPLKADTSFGFRVTSDTHHLKFYVEQQNGYKKVINGVLTDIVGCRDSLELDLIVSHPRANYSVDDSTLCRGDSVSFHDNLIPNAGTTQWFFGTGDSSTVTAPKYAYDSSGLYTTMYTVTHGPCADTAYRNIRVQGIDSVGFFSNLRDTNCYPAPMLFFDQSIGDSLKWFTWDFGDGRVPIRTQQRDSLNKIYNEPGIFDVKLIVETSNGCKDSISYPQYIRVTGPYASYSIVPDSVCIYEPLSFVVDSMNPFAWSFLWDFGDGRIDSTGRSVDSLHHTYSRTGTIQAVMVLEDSLRTCKVINTREVVVEEVIADFRFNPDSIGCMPFEMHLQDRSQLGDTWNYQFGDGNQSTQADPVNTYQAEGDYTVTLIYENSQNGCKDTIQKPVHVDPLPEVIASSDRWICLGDSVRLSASGAVVYTWSPNVNIDDTSKTSPTVWPAQHQQYIVEGRDANWCANTDSTWVYVQQHPTLTMPPDTLIIIGEEVHIQPTTFQAYTWSWTPPDGLSCTDCPDPVAQPLRTTEYTLTIGDSLGCFEAIQVMKIEVEVKFSVSVPEAFTPNGDGVNDLIYPAGWGLKDVVDFKVYNRWGEMVFESSPDQLGWDGYYKGELQNMETYIYVVRVRTYDDVITTEEGYFSLIR